MKKTDIFGGGYAEFLAELKQRIAAARIVAARSVNRELIMLYWDIGRGIVEKQKQLGWGESVIDKLAKDLQRNFAGSAGFSARNLRNMKQLYEAYSNPVFWQQAVAKLPGGSKWQRAVAKSGTGKIGNEQFLRQVVAETPWGHHLLILNKVAEPAGRLFYLQGIRQLGWSRNDLFQQIRGQAYERARVEKRTHNFEAVLPETLAEQADEALKSNYNLEFLGIKRVARERQLESRLIGRIRDFILELGYGFCFIGSQYRLTLGDKDYFIDLLFYHRFLKALVAIELKAGPFMPEHAGKMDFYLNLLNDREKGPGDNPAIGIILCGGKDELEVEFSLKTKTNPIGVANYQLLPKLPKELKGKLPSERELRAALVDFTRENRQP